MSPKTKLKKISVENEEHIIDYVKRHEILYNVHNKSFRKYEYKNKLWQKLADELNMDVNDTRKKWSNMRDYFMNKYKKKTPGKSLSDQLTKRDTSLLFLVQRENMLPNISDSGCSETQQDAIDAIDPLDNVTTLEESQISNEDDEYFHPITRFKTTSSILSSSTVSGSDIDNTTSSSPTPPKAKSRNNKKTQTEEENKLLRELVNRNTQLDHIDMFFNSMASTVRLFSPHCIAKIKCKIFEIVSAEEQAHALDSEQQMKQE